jgi:hypothetical protein
MATFINSPTLIELRDLKKNYLLGDVEVPVLKGISKIGRASC